MKEKNIKPSISISLDCVPKNKQVLKNNIINIYNVCNEVIDNPNCFYKKEELLELKNNKENILII